ncbi:hypothetical protein N665_0026s0058 [Sinapis alba]|nr:hypothetical protein N665_0026s0058 [Sinapis alba]
MTSSSSSSLTYPRRSTSGISTRFWCGANLTTFAAFTKENQCRRFYRCVLGVQRKTESHLFKWVDEAIVDEIKKIADNLSRLQTDYDSLNRSLTKRLENQNKYIEESILLMTSFLEEKLTPLYETIQASNHRVTASTPQSPLLNIAVAAFALGTMAWMYAKLSN